jgi:hypothetical protein
MSIMLRSVAIREAWQRVRVDLRVLWDDAAGRLHEALDSGLDQRDLNRFTKRARILADAIRRREPLLAGPGLTRYAATKVMAEVLEGRHEQARQAEILHVLMCSDALDDDEDLAS